VHKTKGLLDLVHTDVWGPSPFASIGGACYYITFIDNFSRKVWVYLLKLSEVQGVKNQGGESKRAKDEVLDVR